MLPGCRFSPALKGAAAEAKKSGRLPYKLKWWPWVAPLEVSRMSASQKPEALSVLLCYCACSQDEGVLHQRWRQQEQGSRGENPVPPVYTNARTSSRIFWKLSTVKGLSKSFCTSDLKIFLLAGGQRGQKNTLTFMKKDMIMKKKATETIQGKHGKVPSVWPNAQHQFRPRQPTI